VPVVTWIRLHLNQRQNFDCVSGNNARPEGLGKKTLKFGLDESTEQNEDCGWLFDIHNISNRLLFFGKGENFSGLQGIDNKPIALRNF
jgi:hypothetical protein